MKNEMEKRALVRVLKTRGLDEDQMVVVLWRLQEVSQMEELTEWMELNPEADDMEILEKTSEIKEASQQEEPTSNM